MENEGEEKRRRDVDQRKEKREKKENKCIVEEKGTLRKRYVGGC